MVAYVNKTPSVPIARDLSITKGHTKYKIKLTDLFYDQKYTNSRLRGLYLNLERKILLPDEQTYHTDEL